MAKTDTNNGKNGRSGSVRYRAFAEDLRRQINSGELQVGEKLPSYNELYNSCGAATYTIDRAYSLLEQEGLIERRARSGVYVAQPNARRTQDVIGLAFSTLAEYRHHPYFTELLGGVQQVLEEDEMGLLLIGAQNEAVMWEKVGGVILYEIDTAGLWKRFCSLPPGMPAVSLLERCEQGNLSSVLADDYGGMHRATEHLLVTNHKRIAYLAGTQVPAGARRFAGYRDAMQEAGISPQADWLWEISAIAAGKNFVDAGKQEMQRWLDEGWSDLGCTALICQNDEVAVGAMQALQNSGLNVPENVSVMGFDDQRICRLVAPTLSTVHVPLHQIGVRAAKLLLWQMRRDQKDAPSEAHSVVLPTTLQPRQSIKSLSIRNKRNGGKI